MADFEPKIIAFCCNYCAYAAGDLAGSMRLSYPTNVRIVRLPCSGRAEIQEVLDALYNGADGVLVVGCEEGDCHFIGGNFKAKSRMDRARELLIEANIEPERVEFRHNSAAHGPQLAVLFEEFTNKIKELGPIMSPNPVAKTEEQAEANQ